MAELTPAPFADLVTRLYREPATQDALFELPRRKWWLPSPGDPDLSVDFQGRVAGNPSGPAAGPHTQMAQNLLLSYAAGGRILELKTVQVNDRLEIPRPCIDMTNVGYNVEWSQELLVEQSLHEYVAGTMLIAMFRRNRDFTGGSLDGPAGQVVYDMSVGYDLKGIRSDKVRGFLNGMCDASATIEKLRSEIPSEYKAARDAAYDPHLSGTLTLSTFHGCPADEIESICEFLIAEHDLDVIVKMNPPTLGREKLEHLLHDVLGYTEIRVPPHAYDSVVGFDDSVELAQRLIAFGAARNRRVGFKFSNTLEVVNHRDVFTPDNKQMYLSGQPLHVITMTLTDEFRQAVGPDVPISFSAGIDKQNFATAAACGFVPITASTDLLRPGGYGRLGTYLAALTKEMQSAGARSVDEFILRSFPDKAEAGEGTPAANPPIQNPNSKIQNGTVRAKAQRNTTKAAEQAKQDPRYRADANRKVPKRIDSHLAVFDCVTCDKCVPVCPNAANFTYPVPLIAFDYHDLLVASDGTWRPADEVRRFEITQKHQIACYADFCNECGNCDTFCPEYGGPYIEKPSFFGTVETWRAAAPRDGFVIERWPTGDSILGRIKGREYRLTKPHMNEKLAFDDGEVVLICTDTAEVAEIQTTGTHSDERHVDMWAFHTLRHLLAGILDASQVNQVNVT